jgi:APA family basic amino acid/polyamine antiporter
MARRKKREGQSLHKVLGVPALFSTAYGNVGSSIYYALGAVAAYALGVTPVVFMLTGLLFVTTAYSYAEATTMFPEAGGSSSFARHTFNEFVSFVAGWGLMLDYIITIAISAFFVPNYLAAFWAPLKTWPYNSIGGIVVIAALVAINIFGIKEAARLNIVLAVADLSTQVLLAIVGVFVFLSPRLLITQIHLGTSPTWHQLIYGISIGTVAYTGIETISNMAEESADPGRDVPRAVNFVLAAVLGVYFAISMVGLSAMPVNYNVLPVGADGKTTPVPVVVKSESQPNGPYVFKGAPPPGNVGNDVFMPVKDGETQSLKPTGAVFTQDGQRYTKLYGTQLSSVYLEDPLLGIVQNLPGELEWLKAFLRPWIGILAATILIIGTNAGIIGSSRLAYSMAGHRQIPPVLSRVHPRRLTPYVAIAAFGAIAALLIVPGSVYFLVDLYAFGAMISFTVAHLCVVWLRMKEPERERPWRTPVNIPIGGGRSIPVLAVLGGIGTAVVWCVVVATHVAGRYIGLSWMAAGIIMYVLYRRHQGVSLTRTVAVPVLPESVTTDIDYDQLLVPIVGSRITDEMMVLACQLATEKGSAIDALYVIEVPFNLPLDARLIAERERATQVLDRAAVIADQFKIRITPIVVTARSVGRAIVDEAVERRSEVIILGVIKKRRFTERAFGGTIDYVMEHAPCEVLINLVPPIGVYEGEQAPSTRVGGPGKAWTTVSGAPAAGDEAGGDGGGVPEPAPPASSDPDPAD